MAETFDLCALNTWISRQSRDSSPAAVFDHGADERRRSSSPGALQHHDRNRRGNRGGLGALLHGSSGGQRRRGALVPYYTAAEVDAAIATAVEMQQ